MPSTEITLDDFERARIAHHQQYGRYPTHCVVNPQTYTRLRELIFRDRAPEISDTPVTVMGVRIEMSNYPRDGYFGFTTPDSDHVADSLGYAISMLSRNQLRETFPEMPRFPAADPGKVHFKKRNGWKQTKDAESGAVYAERLMMPEMVTRPFIPAQETIAEPSTRIQSVEYRKVKEVTTRNLRTGSVKMDHYYEEV